MLETLTVKNLAVVEAARILFGPGLNVITGETGAGKSVVDAAIAGADLRYRAVMMTAWSFIIGVLPLVFASGAGSGAMKAIGICTCSGMLVSSVVGIVFVPALYALFQRLREIFAS